ncbi:MAG: Rad52/Rad22 family DNA repair protein [Halobacteria archaeon]
MTNKDLLEALSSPFPLSDVRQRRLSSKSNVVITYVSIDATIRRLNEVLGDKWSTRLVHVDVVPVTRKLDVAYLASIAIELRLWIR